MGYGYELGIVSALGSCDALPRLPGSRTTVSRVIVRSRAIFPTTQAANPRHTLTTSDPGTYVYNYESCVYCPIGKYAPTAQTGACLDCVSGFYTGVRLSATSCLSCNAGKYSEGLAMNCSTCTGGKWSGSSDSACTDCSAGKYSGESQSSCDFCGGGTYSLGGTHNCSSW